MKTETALLTPQGLIRQIEVRLKNQSGIMAECVKNAIEEGHRDRDIIGMLKEQAQDSRSKRGIVEMLGKELTDEILNF